ncbi:MAG TPA: tetratricopeptide repeat protein [Longimicrobiales bacterium]|nr:tetratricopeptide repeat protein [Longimicrobiales bacterium]
MSGFRRVVREVHRRSLWQVLSIYLVGSWVALQVVESLTESAGLPDWVPSFALVLLVIGLPIVMATAFVQEGMGGGAGAADATGEGRGGEVGDEDAAERGSAPPELEAGRHDEAGERRPGTVAAAGSGGGEDSATGVDTGLHHSLFTWRNAIVGGVLAVALLAAAIGTYFFMWSSGIGPVGSLVAQGVLDERDPVVLAEFGNATPDSLLSDVVTEALRVDLLESPILTVVDPSFTRQVLQRMQRDPDTRLTAELAREVAVREGLKAVIQGEVGSAGEGYVLTARLVEATSGRTLAAFRETAEDDGALIGAIDKLSQAIREKAGESLRSIKGGEELETVTTASLDALRKFTQAQEVADRGEPERGVELLEEAVAQDSTFAMAWRKLGVLLGNMGGFEARRDSALTRAYRLRDRLSDRERYLTIAHYHFTITDSLDRAARAYRNVLDVFPDDAIALNNLALVRMRRDDREGALALLDRAVSGPAETSVAHSNRVEALAWLGRFDDARAASARYAERYPEDYRALQARALVEAGAERFEEAEALVREGLERFDTNLARARFKHHQGILAIARGRLGDADARYEEMVEAAPRGAEHALRDMTLARLVLGEDPALLLAEVRDAYATGALSDLPPGQRDWPFILGVTALAGDASALEAGMERALEFAPPSVSEDRIEGVRAEMYGRLALGREEWDEAVARFEEARRLLDCGRCFLAEIGIAHAEAGRGDEAIEAMEEWLEPGAFDFDRAAWDPVVLEHLGVLYEERGDTAAALDAWRRLARRWEDADPRFRPRVEAALQRWEALEGGGSPRGG